VDCHSVLGEESSAGHQNTAFGREFYNLVAIARRKPSSVSMVTPKSQAERVVLHGRYADWKSGRK
jgi:hypothetical protein